MFIKSVTSAVILIVAISFAMGEPLGTIYGSEFSSPPNNNPAITTITGKDPAIWKADVTFELLANRIVSQKIQDFRLSADPEKLREQERIYAPSITTQSLVQARETATSLIAVSKLYRQRFGTKAPSPAEKAAFLKEISNISDFTGLTESKLDSLIQQIDNMEDGGEKMISTLPPNPHAAQKQLFDVLEYGEKEKAFFDLVTSTTVVSESELEKAKSRFLDDPMLRAFVNFPDLLKPRVLEKKKIVIYNQYLLATIDKDLKVSNPAKFAEFRKRWQTELIDSWDCFDLK